MSKGFSLHVGVDDARHNFPNAPILNGCKNDACAMRDIAELCGFSNPKLLLDEKANYNNVEGAIRAAAEGPDALADGDIFLFTFAGHGRRVSDTDRDERDGFDEALLLFDYILLDDVLQRVLWPLFKPGVRVLMVADSCYSGDVLSLLTADAAGIGRKTKRASCRDLETAMTTDIKAAASDIPPQARTISDDVLYQHLWKHRDFYEKVLSNVPSLATAPPVNASVLLLAACKADEKAGDGPHGVYTEALQKVWSNGTFGGTYQEFTDAIGRRIPPGQHQHPQINFTGQPNPQFVAQRPFTVPFP